MKQAKNYTIMCLRLVRRWSGDEGVFSHNLIMHKQMWKIKSHQWILPIFHICLCMIKLWEKAPSLPDHLLTSLRHVNPIWCGGGRIWDTATFNINISKTIRPRSFKLDDFYLPCVWMFLRKCKAFRWLNKKVIRIFITVPRNFEVNCKNICGCKILKKIAFEL